MLAEQTESRQTPNHLAVRAQRARLVKEFETIVRAHARKVSRRVALSRTQTVLDEDDLYSVGMLGLFDASERFDPDNGNDFRSFAEYRIRGAMFDEVRRRDIMPRRLRAKSKRYFEACRLLARELGRQPTSAELCDVLDMESDELERLRLNIERYNSAPTEVFAGLQSGFPSPEECFEAKERVHALEMALRELPEREQLVLDLYFRRDLNLKEIASILEVTEGRISQLKSAAIKKMRVLVESQMALQD